MISIRPAGAAALALLLAACGEKQNATPENRAAAANAPEMAASNQVYSGSGTIQSIAGDQVTIAHGPIPAIGWPAMTMAYTAPSVIFGSVKVGDKVGFSFHKSGIGYVLKSVQPR